MNKRNFIFLGKGDFGRKAECQRQPGTPLRWWEVLTRQRPDGGSRCRIQNCTEDCPGLGSLPGDCTGGVAHFDDSLCRFARAMSIEHKSEHGVAGAGLMSSSILEMFPSSLRSCTNRRGFLCRKSCGQSMRTIVSSKLKQDLEIFLVAGKERGQTNSQMRAILPHAQKYRPK